MQRHSLTQFFDSLNENVDQSHWLSVLQKLSEKKLQGLITADILEVVIASSFSPSGRLLSDIQRYSNILSG